MPANQKKARHSSRAGISIPQILIVIGAAVLAVALLVVLNFDRLQPVTANIAVMLLYRVGIYHHSSRTCLQRRCGMRRPEHSDGKTLPP